MVALTRTKARVVLTVLKTCFAEESSTGSRFKISIDTLALRGRVAISAGLVYGVLAGWWRLSSSGVGGLTCGPYALRQR